MAEVKWIKITADIFENRKIRQIESLPDGDAVIVIWLKLLCLAGQINDRGAVYFTQEIPYTEEMMATQFNRPLQTIKMALQVFQQFGMIEIKSDILKISNWEKYQNADGLDRIREQTRQRVAKHRENQKKLQCNATVTLRNATEEEEEKELEEEKEKELEREEEKKEKKKSASAPAPVRHKYGEYKNVLLTDQELEKLKTEFPGSWTVRIESLSSYMKSTGKSYKDHLATIRNWARRDAEKEKQKNGTKNKAAEELSESYEMMARWAEE